MFYISQMKQDDCGFASLKMLLANIYKNEDYLYLKQTENHGPYNYFELIDIAKDYGLILSGCKATQKEEFPEFDEYPFIATIDVGDGPHAVTVLKKRYKKVCLLDPSRGVIWMKIDEFINVWDGTLLKIEDKIESKKSPNNVLKKFDNLKKFKYSLQIIQVFLSISFICCLIFLGTTLPTYVSGIFLCLYMVGEIVFREVILKLTNDFDLMILDEMKCLPVDGYLFINRLNECKKNLFVNKISIISNIILVASLIFMLVFNGIFNSIIVFATIILCLVNSFLIKPYMKKREEVIARLENVIAREKNLNKFKEDYREVNSLSNKYAKDTFFFRIIGVAILSASILLATFLGKQLTPISFAFYLMLSLYLQRGISDLFEIDEKRKITKLAKAKLNNLINPE